MSVSGISRVGCLLVAGMAILAAPVAAAPTVYTSRASFLAALAASTVQDYASILPADSGTEVSTYLDPLFSYTAGGVTLLSPREVFGYYDFVGDNAYVTTGFSAPDVAPDRLLTIALGAGVNGIGLDLLDYQSDDTPGTDPIAITAFGVTTLLDGTPTLDAPQFFGIIDSAALTTTLTISRADQVFYPLSLDNVTYGRAAAVPEPATMGLFGLGVLLLTGIRRRS